MISQPSVKTLAITASATVLASELNVVYYTTCSLNLSGAGHIAITDSGTPKEGTSRTFICNFNTTNYSEATDDVLFYGAVVPAELAAKTFLTIASYNASAWRVFFLPSLQNSDLIDAGLIKADAITASEIATGAVTTTEILDGTIATIDIADAAITNAKMDNMAQDTFKMRATGAGTGVPINGTLTQARTALAQTITLTGLVTAGSTAETAGTGNTSLTTTIAAGSVTHAMLTSAAQLDDKQLFVSFEASEVGTIGFNIAKACTVESVIYRVTRVLAGTDNGAVSLLDHLGNTMTGSAQAITASSTVGTSFGAYTITANNAIAASENIQIVTSKVTAGGRICVNVKLRWV